MKITFDNAVSFETTETATLHSASISITDFEAPLQIIFDIANGSLETFTKFRKALIDNHTEDGIYNVDINGEAMKITHINSDYTFDTHRIHVMAAIV